MMDTRPRTTVTDELFRNWVAAAALLCAVMP